MHEALRLKNLGQAQDKKFTEICEMLEGIEYKYEDTIDLVRSIAPWRP